MQGFLSALLAAALLAHAVVGCCWHHDHESLAGCVDRHGATAPGEDPAHDQAGHEHEGPQACQGGKCHAVRPDNPSRVILVQTGSLVAILPLPTLGVALSADQADRSFSGGVVSRPSVRLHLLNQVLLI